eukprot:CAMPEP_0172672478 /NCGR_PEP_ID=MMETSP1074-20121228/11577_1 /TAXON_ID=2916 /ORGANISM="Ceratium fusus, Strain PA161109" /LENGTH=88 /DNA_ID=CAMNT_0013489675 /DNA_START=355 /DNA_END=621 /DNA_ORIENTATION=+
MKSNTRWRMLVHVRRAPQTHRGTGVPSAGGHEALAAAAVLLSVPRPFGSGQLAASVEGMASDRGSLSVMCEAANAAAASAPNSSNSLI